MHLEVATSLPTDDFLLAFRRFLALYGKPASMSSDNETNFVEVERKLLKGVRKLNKERTLLNWTEGKSLSLKFQSLKEPLTWAHQSVDKSGKSTFYRAEYSSARLSKFEPYIDR